MTKAAEQRHHDTTHHQSQVFHMQLLYVYFAFYVKKVLVVFVAFFMNHMLQNAKLLVSGS